MTDLCPKCRSPVLRTADGDLQPRPSPMGIWSPDGGKHSAFDLRVATVQGRTIGHMRHECPPVTPAPTLF